MGFERQRYQGGTRTDDGLATPVIFRAGSLHFPAERETSLPRNLSTGWRLWKMMMRHVPAHYVPSTCASAAWHSVKRRAAPAADLAIRKSLLFLTITDSHSDRPVLMRWDTRSGICTVGMVKANGSTGVICHGRR